MRLHDNSIARLQDEDVCLFNYSMQVRLPGSPVVLAHSLLCKTTDDLDTCACLQAFPCMLLHPCTAGVSGRMESYDRCTNGSGGGVDCPLGHWVHVCEKRSLGLQHFSLLLHELISETTSALPRLFESYLQGLVEDIHKALTFVCQTQLF